VWNSAETEPVGVISPHMDDAALSCGSLLANHPGSLVVTVFSGGPASVDPLPPWDQRSGYFRLGDNVMALRAVEDDAAMRVVGARALRLGFWDVQYRSGRSLLFSRIFRRAARSQLIRPLPHAVRSELSRLADHHLQVDVEAALRRVVQTSSITTWFMPLGLCHPDHKITASASSRLAASITGKAWVVYEDLPYGIEAPQDAEATRVSLHEAGFTLEPAFTEGSPDPRAIKTKRAMVACYKSQLPCLGSRSDLAIDSREVYFRLVTKQARIGR